MSTATTNRPTVIYADDLTYHQYLTTLARAARAGGLTVVFGSSQSMTPQGPKDVAATGYALVRAVWHDSHLWSDAPHGAAEAAGIERQAEAAAGDRPVLVMIETGFTPQADCEMFTRIAENPAVHTVVVVAAAHE